MGAGQSRPANPQAPRRGTRGRRGRGRGARQAKQASQPAQGGTYQSAQGLRLRNSEILTPAAPATGKHIVAWEFAPGATNMPILDRNAETFTRYNVSSVTIAYIASDATTSSQEIVWGIDAGPKRDEMDTKADIMCLRPVKIHATWKSESVTLGKDINPQKYLFCAGGSGSDKSLFTLYYAIDKPTGHFKITYDIYFNYPNPKPASKSKIQQLEQELALLRAS